MSLIQSCAHEWANLNVLKRPAKQRVSEIGKLLSQQWIQT